ncbi:MAG: hypothetical protein FIA91_10930 [Geobacter sp.]|nr:hypothetical protein [Geobacter sp.]
MLNTLKIKNIAILIEFIAGSGLAIFFHWVLEMPQAAYTIFGIGILLSLVTYLLREELEQTREKLVEQYHHSHELTFAVAQISDPECHAKANELLAGTKRTITLLQHGFIPLDETEFYLEGAKCTDQTQRQIKVVDPMTPGWLTRGALINFYQANLRAIERGVRITRVFVINRLELADAEVQKVLLGQLRDGIDVRVAFRDEIPAASDLSGHDTASSCDFAIYDDRITTDVFPLSGKFYGRKTAVTAEIAKYLHLYDLIEHNAHAVSEQDEHIVLAVEALALAS